MSDVGGPPGVPLGYETPRRQGVSGVRQAAWICLLVLGILTILLGLCLGGMVGCLSLAFHTIAVAAGGGGGGGGAGGGAPGMPAIPSYMPWVMWGVAAVLLLGPIGFGVGEIVCGVKLRNGSKAAGVVAAVLVGLQLMLVLLSVGASVVGASVVRAAVSGRGDWGNMIFSGLFYLAIGAMLGVVEWLLVKVIREPRNAWAAR